MEGYGNTGNRADIFTSYDNPKDNADRGRVLRMIKEDLIWLNEFSSLEEERDKIGHGLRLITINFMFILGVAI